MEWPKIIVGFFDEHIKMVAMKDIVEVLFFTLIVYYFSLWLSKDKQKNLLLYFYAYSGVIMLSGYFSLTIINQFMIIFAPVFIMFFILVHQEILQRNFITLNNIKPAIAIKQDWLEMLIRSCLIARTKGKHIICLIEQHNNMGDFIDAPFIINAHLHENLFDILVESSFFDSTKMIWINAQGQVIALNAQWKTGITENSTFNEKCTITRLKEQALAITAKTDALLLSISPTQPLFDILYKGKRLENLAADHVMKILKNYLSEVPKYKMGAPTYEAISKINSFKQKQS